MNVLEDFWYGNLDPAEYDACPDEEYKELKTNEIAALVKGRIQKAIEEHIES